MPGIEAIWFKITVNTRLSGIFAPAFNCKADGVRDADIRGLKAFG
jgi:hypothetical protein